MSKFEKISATIMISWFMSMMITFPTLPTTDYLKDLTGSYGLILYYITMFHLSIFIIMALILIWRKRS